MAGRVVDSYKRTGAVPAQGVLWDPLTKMACGVGACFVADGGDPSGFTVLQAASRLGLGSMYASGFIKGFDDWPDGTGLAQAQEKGWDEKWKDGFRDGLGAASAVFVPLTRPAEGGTMTA